MAAIVGAWNLLEEGTISAAMAKGISFPEHLPNYQIMRLLEESGYVDRVETLYKRLRSIRNEAVHSKGEPIDQELAKRYIDLVWPLYGQLLKIARSNNNST